jgi:hypothetical protein
MKQSKTLAATVRRIRILTVPLLLCGAMALPASAAPPDGAGSWDDLVALFKEFGAWKESAAVNVADYGPAAVDRRRAEIRDLQSRLDEMGARRWPVPQQVDFLTVRAELDQQEFILHITRPWARDPVFYVANLQANAFVELPATGNELRDLQRELRSVPAVLEAARDNLTEVAADYADLAIRSLTLSDGVEDGYPYRENPPAGVIGWYEDLLERADDQPELKPDISRALGAIRDFHEWLVDHRDEMNEPNGVGKEALDWFVQNALLLPYTSEEMAVLSQRELDRMWAFYALERHRNRELPELRIASSGKEYRQRVASTDGLVRNWLEEEEIITIPDYIPEDWQVMGYNVPWMVRSTPPNFWEQVQFRDPSPDHLHAVIPGHRFDALMAANNEHPIRGQVNFGARWQGWAVYLEEAPLQLGVLESRPRTRELIYVFGLWRAARSLGDIYNQWNDMTAAETAEYWMEVTPMLDPNVARKYAYLRPAPGHGLEYTIGNIQMFSLLAARKRQLGEEFVLKEFHDEFMSKGRIPIALIQYEMTGDATAVDRFWNRTPLSSLKSQR